MKQTAASDGLLQGDCFRNRSSLVH
jgi:hypothetical protein